MFTIHGWKTLGSTSLCRTCANAHIKRGGAQNQEELICDAVFNKPVVLTYPIVECSDFCDKNLPTIGEMNKIAWFINADKKTGKVGFVSGEKVTDSMKEETHDGNIFNP
jgi:hypothetical protein